MQITYYERINETFAIGLAVGDGQSFRFAVWNKDGVISRLEEKIDGEWFIDPSPPPFFLRALIGAKAADERWRHNEGPAVADLRSEA